MANSIPITQELVQQLLDYDPATGILIWLPRGGRQNWDTKLAGKPALNHIDTNGYLYGRIFYKRQYAHRIAWIHYHGSVSKDIDHINGKRDDNRIENLREVSRSDNLRNRMMSRNNTSGKMGVSLTNWNTWKATICQKVIGSFATKEEAIAAREQAEREYGFHPNHGRR